MIQNNYADQEIPSRLDEAIELSGLSEHAVFGLSVRPSPPVRLPTLFAGRDAPIVKDFDNPPSLRRAGFDLKHGGNSSIVRGELRRALVPGWKILELWRDGVMIYAVDALVQPCWGSPRPDGNLYVNPLALCEPVFVFAKLSGLIYQELAQRPTEIIYQVSFRRLIIENHYAQLSEGALNKYFFADGSSHTATEANMDRTVIWSQEDVDPEAVAYELVQEVYHWFGIEDTGIPYTKKRSSGQTVIDSTALVEAGK